MLSLSAFRENPFLTPSLNPSVFNISAQDKLSDTVPCDISQNQVFESLSTGRVFESNLLLPNAVPVEIPQPHDCEKRRQGQRLRTTSCSQTLSLSTSLKIMFLRYVGKDKV